MSTVLILGATSDTGKAIARRYAAAGWNLQLAARNTTQLEPLCSDLRIRHGVDAAAFAFDATAFTSHENFYRQLPVKPDVAICVFGYMKDNEMVAASLDETLRTVQTNFTGAVTILNIIAADFGSRGKGAIAGISSVAGLRGRQSNYVYGSAKAGFTAYLSGLRNRMYHSRVHVMTVLPGFVNTRMTEHLKLPKLLTAEPEQVADAVYRGLEKKKNIIYVRWFWRWIMMIIRNLPEFIFKKKKL